MLALMLKPNLLEGKDCHCTHWAYACNDLHVRHVLATTFLSYLSMFFCDVFALHVFLIPHVNASFMVHMAQIGSTAYQYHLSYYVAVAQCEPICCHESA